MHKYLILIFMGTWVSPLNAAIDSNNFNEYELCSHQLLQELHSEPYNPHTVLSLGFILKKLNRYQQAIALYEHARPLIEQKSSIERALSGAYLALGDFQNGWPAYEYRWVNPPAHNIELYQYLENGGSLHNKIVLLKTEYGLGDTLHFIRYAKCLKEKGAKVIVECQLPLIPLLKLCPYIDELHPQGTVIGAHFFALLMSMPLIMNTTIETIPQEIPYLFAQQSLIDFWKNRLASDKKMHIGICWQADIHQNSNNQTVRIDAQSKSIPLVFFSDVADLEDVQLYSLQKINGLEQLDSLKNIIHFDDLDAKNGPFMDTAALMKNLDLVITIDTSIAHLAGGLGVPCWLLLSYGADWRWLGGMPEYEFTSPWYPNMRLFRQKNPSDWQAVIDVIKQALTKA